MIVESSRKKKTRALYNKISGVLEGHDLETVFAALVPLLVAVHLDSHSDAKGDLCLRYSNAGLIELVQSIRKINDEILEGI